MAFRDIEKVLYDGEVLIKYKDSSHAYYAHDRMDWDRDASDPKAWGKSRRPKGTTTLIGDTLEKKGLMQWPKGLALRELFGFYDFTTEDGERKAGFSKPATGIGTLWALGGTLASFSKEALLPLVQSADKAWQRKQKKGADIGSVVHDAIEHYVKGEEFDIVETYTNSVNSAEYATDVDRQAANADIKPDTDMAILAFMRFMEWWKLADAKLLGAEDLVYSKKYDYCGTFDGLIKIDGKIVLCDWKTSNASASKDAAMPEGINYSYFIQSAMYADAWQEMGNQGIDDLLIVSCRKDGGFTTKYLSEMGMTVPQAIEWARAVVQCYRSMAQVKDKLLETANASI